MDNKSLAHHGVKGMRWGVRRFQNKDGTLTPAGRKRYEQELSQLKTESKNLRNAERTKAKLDKLDEMRRDVESRKKALEDGSSSKTTNSKPSKPVQKRIRDMTDEEIIARKARLELEKEYKKLLSETRDEQVAKGKAFVENVLTKSGEELATQTLKYLGAKGLNSLINEKDKDGNLVEVIFSNNKKK